ncbi:MAG: phosphodiester glycosidase family protein [Planctomycetes bacterium]|nr:phosphodiester glycosidase family protein [Planctomycetota bacterium]
MRRALLAFLAFASSLQLAAQEPDLAKAPWVRREIGDGVHWHTLRTRQLFGAPQNVDVLEIELDPKRVRLEIAPAKGLQRTSQIASAAKALAAVNGGYFSKEGRPVGLLRSDGKPITPNDGERYGAIGIAADGKVRIEKPPMGDWPKMHHALGAGPMLVRGGKVDVSSGFGHEKARHPRTAVGLTAKNRLLLVTVDGRAAEAAGMTCAELAACMLQLGCVDALNLDGGGSTTMWVRGEPHGGVVNHPSDNKRFDHQGERAVANAILVFATRHVVLDDATAELLPEGRWKRTGAGDDFLGAGLATIDQGTDARAAWTLPFTGPCHFEVQIRWPKGTELPRKAVVWIGAQRCEVVPTRAAGAWLRVGELHVEQAGEVRLEVAGDDAGPFSVDALRLRELR